MSFLSRLFICCACLFLASDLFAQHSEQPDGSLKRTLEEARKVGAQRSRFLGKAQTSEAKVLQKEADLETFRRKIQPLLKSACESCHGEEEQEADFRTDQLDPNLIQGDDEKWWLEVQNVLSNAEMPPADADVQLSDVERALIIDWLSKEIQVASRVRRDQKSHSSFRRLTRYEYSYALQDLLGLPYEFGRDLPPETPSADGFLNSAEMLQMSPTQFAIYRELARKALIKATVRGEQPEPVTYLISMSDAAEKMIRGYNGVKENLEKRIARQEIEPEKAEKQLDSLQKKHLQASLRTAHFLDEENGDRVLAMYRYGSQYSFHPAENKEQPESDHALILPPNTKQYFDLGNYLPASGTMRLRIKLKKVALADDANEPTSLPEFQVNFGYQPSNNSHTNFSAGPPRTITNEGEANWLEWHIHLGEISRNAYRETAKMGSVPNPTEYIILKNLAKDRGAGSIRVEQIEVVAPWHATWPPSSHMAIFPLRNGSDSELGSAKQILESFMAKAWRREVSANEVERKLELFRSLRPVCDEFEDAMIEVLANVLSSPNFIYVGILGEGSEAGDYGLASKLSMFLWSSLPDAELMELAGQGKLREEKVLLKQVDRMLADPRSERFSKHFVRQWLGLQLLDYLDVDKKTYRDVDENVLAAMKREPMELFRHVLNNNHSVMDFLHADYTFANQTLARHYGIENVLGTEFQKVNVGLDHGRGGLLTQAGLLAMNSDGKDSNPLKRGIWLLDRILHDPPPPPPPAVPEIDLADPAILKMTLKERLEDHRSDVACKSCHARIDPWGIAFENFDAVGRWRDKIGKKPVDASSVLFNQERLDGVDGLKRYLLENRQDQFASAMTTKLVSYALGRPLGFSDRSSVESITAKLRKQGDGLKTLVRLTVTSDLFLEK